ncbi:MAG: FprA family A-type flavoprotein [Candidatus Saganbacteria bacterium]|nr:FprA family A-type flavoprotein [Candidatus Saganbacteria bacterium]
MAAQKIKDDIFAVGAVDWDRRLFDELIPLPDGTSYNSYLIKGSEKTVLIDTVDPTKTATLKENLTSLGIKNIDYIICNHAEQDHSGSIPNALEWFPKAKVISSEKCKGMLVDLSLAAEDRIITVKDKETISLGNKTLEFIHASWVHWPETIFSYLREDKILFPCDFLGSHRAQSGLFVENEADVYKSAKRYYAEIMMPFRVSIKGHIEKLASYEINMICPSHGPVYQTPKFIIEAYKDWISDKVANEVVIPYVSMHGSVQKMVEILTDELTKKGITVKPFNIPKTDIGELAMSLVDAATVVIGAPAVLAQAHPLAVYAAYLANALRPKTRFASLIGSFGWGSKLVETITGQLTNLKVELIEPVIIKGYPKENDHKLIQELAENIAEKHKTL